MIGPEPQLVDDPRFRRQLPAWLFTPGTRSDLVAKAPRFGPDVLVIDLEDSVATSEKATARVALQAAIAGLPPEGLVGVRVNAADPSELETDLRAAICPRVDLVVLPKLERAAQLKFVSERMDRLEQERQMPVGRTAIVGSIETARGLVEVEAIADSEVRRLLTLLVGTADLSLDISTDFENAPVALSYARSRVVVAARAGGLVAPIDGPHPRMGEVQTLLADSVTSHRLGFQGRVVPYGPDVMAVQDGYRRIDATRVAEARAIAAAFERAQSQGSAAVRAGDRFIDVPIYLEAKRTLAAVSASPNSVRESQQRVHVRSGIRHDEE